MNEPTRAEHLAWCKKRALEYLEPGTHCDLQQAFTSIASDLRKHPETKDHAGVNLGLMLLMNNGLATPDEMRKFIEGFN